MPDHVNHRIGLPWKEPLLGRFGLGHQALVAAEDGERGLREHVRVALVRQREAQAEIVGSGGRCEDHVRQLDVVGFGPLRVEQDQRAEPDVRVDRLRLRIDITGGFICWPAGGLATVVGLGDAELTPKT